MMKVAHVSLLKLKINWLLLLIVTLSSIYTFKPFINGFGCDFEREVETISYYKKGYCNSGIMIIETEDKVTGTVKLKKFLWGHWQNYNYTLRIQTQTLSSPSPSMTRRLSLYDVTPIVSAYRIPFENQSMKSALLYDKPFELIYITDGIGKLGFIQ
ncbi:MULTISPECIES: hypothetical protein [unclassified Vibrio]|uniref:hypothetical protein n=1 Tax=unclassified Vibrio TaxID=2614977 RepID=UPI000B8EE42D|nr:MULTISPECIES: hypothetical protein [unclassified Vibrio]OXX36160.1 hypothetical protein B9J95_01085 [Vibrio sp. V14_P6S14T42]OXX39254.1 hypothetical protein B9J81_00160 [Vibrio sp. V04_P4A5T148]OXX57392.1 hypothetical protein B9J91_05465 [Vibrio sp. V18_P1S4T112]